MRANPNATPADRALAQICIQCPVCRHARHHQRGPAFWFVHRVESKVCPFCCAYERVYGRKASAKAAAS